MGSARYAITKGHDAERAVARYLREAGHVLATTSRNELGHSGTRQPGDIVGVPGCSIEVKNRRNLNIGESLLQNQLQAGPNKLPLLVVKPVGVSIDAVGDWWAISYMRHAIRWLPWEGEL